MIHRIRILLVEDNEGDILLTTEALTDAKIANEVTVRRDGETALAYLKEIAETDRSQLPDLILLDVNLPRVNGHEVLERIKSDEVLRRLPVIMLTTSSSHRDVERAYHAHANCYIVKPVEIQDFINVVASIEDFWFTIVRLPMESKATDAD